jgi:cytochrome P450
MNIPPKPKPRAARTSIWNYLRLFRADLLSAQPERLYGAWMAEFRALTLRSYLINDPALVDLVLRERPGSFPKSDYMQRGLSPLLGRSLFVVNGAEWKAQKTMLASVFDGGRLPVALPDMVAAGQEALARMKPGEGALEIEAQMSNYTADVIFRALFSAPLSQAQSRRLLAAFQSFQRTQPVMSLAAFLPLPGWLRGGTVRKAAQSIRAMVQAKVTERRAAITAGTAPDDLSTRLLCYRDPQTDAPLTDAQAVDQIALFVLAGHETSASALSWALYLLATHVEAQDAVAREGLAIDWATVTIGDLNDLPYTRRVFKEALRLYPPVPNLLRQTSGDEVFRNRSIVPGSQIVISPWFLHRHTRIWDTPDAFDPDRWERAETRDAAARAYVPFSTGPRVCPGAGFAMQEGVLMLAMLCARFRLAPVAGRVPVPVAHLTLRARDGIYLTLSKR